MRFRVATAVFSFLLWSQQAFAEIEWATAVSKHQTEDRAIVFRFIKTFPEGFSRSEQPDRVILLWRYSSANGMPSRSEREQMDKLEDLLRPIVDRDRIATLVLVSTGENFREWTYYAKKEAAFLARLNETLKGRPRFPIEIHAASDPSWSTYEQFRRELRE